MYKTSAIQILASAIGLTFLCFIVTLGAAFVSADEDYISNAIFANLVAICFAAIVWTGVLWRKSKSNPKGPASWGEWLVVFAGGLGLTLVFLLIDCGGCLPIFHPKFVCAGHLGFSVIFTVGVICLTSIALPSAIRAWILEKFGNVI